jgi:hypothetical protein
MTVFNINWSYISGLLESDGTFLCFMDTKGVYLKPEIRISSKTNTNTLKDVEAFLIKEGVHCTVEEVSVENETSTKAQRAPSLRVQGKDQCSRFSKKLREQGVCLASNDYKCSLLGNKQRDLMLMEEVFKSDPLSPQEKLDLKKSFHKKDYFEKDFISKFITLREGFEQQLRIKTGSSVNAAKELILKVDSRFQEHLEKVNNFNEKLNGSYVAGLFDGDGGFNITFSIKEKERIITFNVDINLSLPEKDFPIFKGVKQTLDIDSVSLPKQKNSRQMKIRRAGLVKKVLNYFDEHPILGDHKIKEINNIKLLCSLKEAGLLTKGTADIEAIKLLIRRVDELSKTMKGPERTPLDVLLAKVDEFYGQKKE